MSSFNRVVLMGNVTRNFEVQRTSAGTAIAEVGLAINDRRRNQAGDWIEETTFVEVTLYGRTAEIVAEYLVKGSPVLIEGRLKLDTWERDGQRRNKLKIIGESVQLIGVNPEMPPKPEVTVARKTKPKTERQTTQAVGTLAK